jgi:hypothetical protein
MEVFIIAEGFFEVSISDEVFLKSGTVCAPLRRTIHQGPFVCQSKIT